MVKADDLRIAAILNKHLAATSVHLVETTISRMLSSEEDGSYVVGHIGGNAHEPVTKRMLRQFGTSEVIQDDVMKCFWKMFQNRDDRIATTFRDVHSRDHAFIPFKQSIFFPPSIFEQLRQNPARTDLDEGALNQTLHYLVFLCVRVLNGV